MRFFFEPPGKNILEVEPVTNLVFMLNQKIVLDLERAVSFLLFFHEL